MTRWIVGSSLKLRLLVLVIAAAVMVAGVGQLRSMPVDALPEFVPPYVEIQTEALGLSAPEVESLITVPMEQNLLNGVAWLDEIHSESVVGLSRITLIFEPGTDLMRARQMVQERLTGAHALPHVSKPPVMIQPLSSTSRVMMIRLSSKELTPIETSVLARWTIKPRLMGVPGVANVAIWGQRERQLQVQVDPQRLQSLGVTLDQVIETTGNALWVSPLTFLEASTPGSGGFIDTPNQRLGIQHLLPIQTAEDLAQIPIEGCTGGLPTSTRHTDANCPTPPQARAPLVIGDVATVAEDHQPLIGDAVTEDGDGILLVIEKFPEANTLEVTRGVEDALDALAPGLPGLQLDSTHFRPATFIESAMDNLAADLLIGALLIVLILIAFVFDWRAGVISAVVLPLSFIAAGLVLALRGATLNAVALAGLAVALGVVIDDAIIDAENILRRVREQRSAGSDKSTAALILEASLIVRGPMIFATLIILLAALPVFAYADLEILGDATGAFFRPLALSYVLAILASMIVALTVTPVLALILLARAPLGPGRSPLMGRIQRRYDRSVTSLIDRPRWTLGIVGFVVLAALATAPFLQTSSAMFPTLKEGDVLIHWAGAPGASLPEMQRVTDLLSDELRSTPGVRNVGAHLGRAVTSDEVAGSNGGELWVSIDPSADYDATVDAIRAVVDGYPGVEHEVLTYSEERLRASRITGGSTVTTRIYGQDLQILQDKAAEIQKRITGIDGVSQAQVQTQPTEPTIEVEVDLAAAQEHGIKPGDVRRSAAALMSGIEVGNLFEEQKVFEVMVIGVPELRHSLTSIENLLIDTPSGNQVRLRDIAEVRIAPNPTVIRHDAVSRYIDVTATVAGREADAVAADIKRTVKDVTFPLEYHAELLQGHAERQDAERRLLGLALGAAVGIFLLLQAAFGSWRLAALSFGVLPMTLLGGALAAVIFVGDLTLGALIGFLGVLALSVRQSIMLVTHLQQVQREDGQTFGPDLVARAARQRLTPILVTALATTAALAPLAIVGSGPGHEILHPMAIVMLGGLLTATLITLFLLPSLYLLVGGSPLPAPRGAPLEMSPVVGSPAD